MKDSSPSDKSILSTPPTKRHCVERHGDIPTSIMQTSKDNISQVPPSTSSSTSREGEVNTTIKMACHHCHGEGQVPSKKRRTKKQKRAFQYAKENGMPLPSPPPQQMEPCQHCSGSGIVDMNIDLPLDINDEDDDKHRLPRVKGNVHIGIVGGGKSKCSL